MTEKSTIMDVEMINRASTRIAHEIIEQCKGVDNVALVGIITRGVPFAEKLKDLIYKFEGKEVKTGKIDITLYRDDLSEINEMPTASKTDIDFSVKDKDIILCDDVIYTGRTARAAIEAVLKYGRPRSIKLAVLIDRGHRELPIKADFVGKNVPTSNSEIIVVKFDSTDNETIVKLFSKD